MASGISMLHAILQVLLFAEGFKHPADAAFLLLHVGMHIQVERGGDVGVAKERAHGLVVAVALDAAGGEAVAQSVVLQPGDAEPGHQPVVIVAVSARFGRRRLVGQDIVVGVDHPPQRFHHGEQLAAHRYLAAGVLGLGRIDDELRVLAFALNDVYALDGAVHGDCPVVHVDVAPSEATHFAYAQSCGQADVDAQVAECEVLLDVVENLPVLCYGEHLRFLGHLRRGVLDVPLAVGHPFVFDSELHYHLQDDENVLYGLDAQPCFKFLQDELLHKFFTQSLSAAECRQDVVLQNQCVSSVCGLLHVAPLVTFPSQRNVFNRFCHNFLNLKGPPIIKECVSLRSQISDSRSFGGSGRKLLLVKLQQALIMV